MRPPRPPLQPPAVALEPRATVKLQLDVDIDLWQQRNFDSATQAAERECRHGRSQLGMRANVTAALVEAYRVGAGLQCTRIELRPAHRVVDVLHGGRIRVLVARAEIERNRDDAVLGHGFMAQALGGAVAQTPGAAVAFDQRRKWPLPARPEYAREQRSCRRDGGIRCRRRRMDRFWV